MSEKREDTPRRRTGIHPPAVLNAKQMIIYFFNRIKQQPHRSQQTRAYSALDILHHLNPQHGRPYAPWWPNVYDVQNALNMLVEDEGYLIRVPEDGEPVRYRLHTSQLPKKKINIPIRVEAGPPKTDESSGIEPSGEN